MLTNATFFTIVSDKYHTIDPLLWSFRKPHQQTKTKKGRNWYKSEHNHSSGWELWDSCHPLGDPTDLPAVQGGSTLRRTAVLLLQTVFWMLQAARWLLCLSGLVLSPPSLPCPLPRGGRTPHQPSPSRTAPTCPWWERWGADWPCRWNFFPLLLICKIRIAALCSHGRCPEEK